MKFLLSPLFPKATKEQKWDQFRIWRNSQLSMSDWTQLNDCPLSSEEVTKIKKYRKFLRNIPKEYNKVEDICFPGLIEIRDYKIIYVEEEWKI